MMTLAMLEGVTFALRDCLEAAKKNGAVIPRTKLCGGGAKSKLWRKIVANVMNLPVDIPQTEQGPGFGAAMLAMVGCGEYQTVQEAGGRDRAGKGDGTARFRYCRTIRGTLSPFHETLSCPQRTVLHRAHSLSFIRARKRRMRKSDAGGDVNAQNAYI